MREDLFSHLGYVIHAEGSREHADEGRDAADHGRTTNAKPEKVLQNK